MGDKRSAFSGRVVRYFAREGKIGAPGPQNYRDVIRGIGKGSPLIPADYVYTIMG